jgi:thioredoxin reductase (NADPH)
VQILSRSPLEKGMSHVPRGSRVDHEAITVREGARVAAVRGDHEHRLAHVTVAVADAIDVVTEAADGLFVFIGAEPRTDWAPELAKDRPASSSPARTCRATCQDARPAYLETSVPGVFAAGDVRSGSVKRVSAAAGEGAMAVQFIHRHLANTGQGEPAKERSTT